VTSIERQRGSRSTSGFGDLSLPAHQDEATLPGQARFSMFKEEIAERLTSLLKQLNSIPDPADAQALINSPATRFWMDTGQWLDEIEAEEFCRHAEVQDLLGQNYFGAEAWLNTFNVSPGRAPSLPVSLTPELLASPCPFSAGETIASTHTLTLIPAAMNGLPSSARSFADVCCERFGAESFTRESDERDWRREAWATQPLLYGSWALVPMVIPGVGSGSTMSELVAERRKSQERRFNGKTVEEQAATERLFYPEYQQLSALEAIMVLAAHGFSRGEQLFSPTTVLRCSDVSRHGGQVIVGSPFPGEISVSCDDRDPRLPMWTAFVGRFIGRKLL